MSPTNRETDILFQPEHFRHERPLGAVGDFDLDRTPERAWAHFVSFQPWLSTSRPFAPEYSSYTASISSMESKKPTMKAALNDSPALMGRPPNSSIRHTYPRWWHQASETASGSRVMPASHGPSLPVLGSRRW